MQAFLDCFSGISGDMFLGALVDLGWPETELQSLPERLGLEGTRIEVEEVKRQGIRGIQVRICGLGPQPFRNLRDVEAVFTRSDLSPKITRRSLEVFTQLAQVESRVHSCPVEAVHFHEIGAVDTILDIVGTVSGLAYLSVEGLFCSPIPLARGWIDCEHGRMPLPAPACAELLKDVPVYGVDGGGELVTPTGAALIKVLADEFTTFPEMRVKDIGYGAGSRDIPEQANLLRIWLGEQSSEEGSVVVELKSYIDDMNPEWYEYLMERLFGMGALDVVISPIHMKKNRPGVEISVMALPGKEDRLSRVLFEESTTSGIRLSRSRRYILPRKIGMVSSPWGNIRAKLITRPNGCITISPEYEDCKEVAQRVNVPLSEVYRAVSRVSVENFIDEEGHSLA
ncbi:MAG: nickel pincer cofactor biosynthesis protein LarC [Nitrospiraceae bacterium]|nr:nickel pincer cofactor biosynthesis protein LarC [Nitrospiraceae bacterium]